MSNIIPPLLSSSPPPMVQELEDEEDEFGDFSAAADFSFGCDGLSLPPTPEHIPRRKSFDSSVDINSNKDEVFDFPGSKSFEKDFQDKRKEEKEERLANGFDEFHSEHPVAIVDSFPSVDSVNIEQSVDNLKDASDFQEFPNKETEGSFKYVIPIKTEVKDEVSESIVNSIELNCDQNQPELDLNNKNNVRVSDSFIENKSLSINIDTHEPPTNKEAVLESKETETLQQSETESKKTVLLEDESFGDFEAHFKSEHEKNDKPPPVDFDDDFGDFENATINISKPSELSEDEFGDFDSCGTKENIRLSPEEVQDIIKTNFPLEDAVEAPIWNGEDLVAKDFIFEKLKDITETNALKFQWISSASQKLLLNALNIDMRNIVSGCKNLTCFSVTVDLFSVVWTGF